MEGRMTAELHLYGLTTSCNILLQHRTHSLASTPTIQYIAHQYELHFPMHR